MYTATGAPITKPDNVAANGIVHIVYDVMFPPTKTSAETINSMSYPSLSRLAELFNNTDVNQGLLNSMFCWNYLLVIKFDKV